MGNEQVKLDPQRFRFCQGFVGPRNGLPQRAGVRVTPCGYWATDGRVMVVVPEPVGIAEPITLVAPPLSRNVESLAWYMEGQWLEVVTRHGKKGAERRRTRFALDMPSGTYPRNDRALELFRRSEVLTSTFAVDVEVLRRFPGSIVLEFHGEKEPVYVVPISPDFPWVGMIMPIDRQFCETTDRALDIAAKCLLP